MQGATCWIFRSIEARSAHPRIQGTAFTVAEWRVLPLNSFILEAAANEADVILEQEQVVRITSEDAAMLLAA